jgi:hypothetical protein
MTSLLARAFILPPELLDSQTGYSRNTAAQSLFIARHLLGSILEMKMVMCGSVAAKYLICQTTFKQTLLELSQFTSIEVF